jgi:hypothetical protein
MEIRRMALVVERTHSLATWCMEIAAIRMACADHCRQIVEQDGEFRALFLSPTSPPNVSHYCYHGMQF